MNHSKLLNLRPFFTLAVSVVLATLADAQNFTDTTSGTDSWQLSGTSGNWSAQLISGSATSVQFENGITFGTGTTTITSIDDIASGTVVNTGNPAYSYTNAFELNNLTLGGTTTTGNNPATIIIAGPTPAAGTALTSGALDFVSNGTTLPTVTLSGKSGTNGVSASTYEGLIYEITDNVVLSNNTTFAGTGNGIFLMEGQLAGSGNLILGGTGSTASLILSEQFAYAQVNNGYAFTGNLVVNSGTLGGVVNSMSGAADNVAALAGSDFYTNGSLTINSGATYAAGNTQATAVGGLYGTGTLNLATNNRSLYLNYVGQTTDVFNGSISGVPAIINNGDGVFSIDSLTAAFGGGVQQFGSGLFIFNGTSSASSSITVANSYGVIEITGSGSGNSLGGGTAALDGGTLWVQPTFVAGGAATPTVNEPLTGANATRIQGGVNVVLDANGNSSMTLVVGSSTNTAASVLTRNGSRGTLTITPTAGIDNLGNSYDNFIVESSTSNTTSPVITVNGLASLGGGTGTGPDIFVANTDTYGTADFATYLYSGATNDGFAAASNDSTISNFYREDTVAGDGVYTNVDNFTGTTNTSVVDLTSATTATPVTLAANTAAYALRITGSGVVDQASTGNLIIDSGTTFTLGSGVSASVTGLILNGGVISGPGSLAVGNTELLVYTDSANGTISSSIMGTDGLTKTGPGTLFLTVPEHLTTTNSQYTIDSGALDVGTFGSTSATLLGNASGGGKILLDGGVLEGNGILAVSTNSIALTGYDGGYAAYNGNLNVYYNGSFTSGTPNPAVALTWGANALVTTGGTYTGGYTLATGTTGIFAETTDQASSEMLIFGSNVSDSKITFENAIALGLTSSDYYRDVYVNLGTGTDSAVLAGVISDTANASFTTAGGVTYTADGVGTHGILKDGPGTLITTANNTYSGNTEVNSGSLFVNGQNGTAAPGYNGPGQGSYTVAPLLTTAAITYTGSGSTGTGNAATSAQYNYYNPNINSVTGLPYGQTTANGALLGGTGTIGLGANQTLTLTGTTAMINGVSTPVLAHLAPGLATSVGLPTVGTLTVGTAGNNNAVIFGVDSALDIYMSATSSGSAASLLMVNGNVTLDPTTELNFNLLSSATGFNPNDVSTSPYQIVDFTGTETGIFAGLANGSTITDDGLAFVINYNSKDITLTLQQTTPEAAYFNGNTSSDFNTASNFYTTAAGTTPVAGPVGSTTNVFLTANAGGSSILALTLNTGNVTINSLTFTGTGTAAAAGVVFSGSNTLTIAAGSGTGITVQSGSGNDSISVPIALGGTQIWANNSAGNFGVSGGISGTGNLALQANSTGNIDLSGGDVNSTGSITNSGSGSGVTTISSVIGGNVTGVTQDSGTSNLILSGANTYAGGTTVSAGTLYANGGVAGSSSVTGTGAVAVASGATLAGSGFIRPTVAGAGITMAAHSTLISGGIQTGSTAGAGLTLDNRVAQGVILDASVGSANLTFSLGAGNINNSTGFDFGSPNTNSSYMTVLGNTDGELKFATGDIITVNDLTGNNNLQLNLDTPYLLILAGTTPNLLVDNELYAGLVTSGGVIDGVLQNGWVTNLTLGGTAAGENYATGLYLYNGDLEISEDPEVVPEPGTWAMILGGLVLLVVIQRRKNKPA